MINANNKQNLKQNNKKDNVRSSASKSIVPYVDDELLDVGPLQLLQPFDLLLQREDGRGAVSPVVGQELELKEIIVLRVLSTVNMHFLYHYKKKYYLPKKIFQNIFYLKCSLLLQMTIVKLKKLCVLSAFICKYAFS